MKIAVVGCNGRVGSLVVKEAVKRGIEVTGFGPEENRSEVNDFVMKDGLSLTREELLSFDAVVDAVGGWTPDTIPNIAKVMTHLASILDGSNVRLICVGGAGSLYTNAERTLTVDMGSDFPDSWKPLSNAHKEGLAALKASKNLDWTSLSPACNFIADGERTGKYKLGGEDLILSSKGTSEISYADYAIALVDVLESDKHHCERISVVSA